MRRALLVLGAVVALSGQTAPSVPLSAYTTLLRQVGALEAVCGPLKDLQADVIEQKVGDLAWARRQIEAANHTMTLGPDWKLIEKPKPQDPATPVK